MRRLALPAALVFLLAAPSATAQPPVGSDGLTLTVTPLPDLAEPLTVGKPVSLTLAFTLACTGATGTATAVQRTERVTFTAEASLRSGLSPASGIAITGGEPVDVELPDCVLSNATQGQAGFTLEATRAAVGEVSIEATLTARIEASDAHGPLESASSFGFRVAFVGEIQGTVLTPELSVPRRREAVFEFEVENLGNALTNVHLKVEPEGFAHATPFLLGDPSGHSAAPAKTTVRLTAAWMKDMDGGAGAEVPIRLIATPTSPNTMAKGPSITLEFLLVKEGLEGRDAPGPPFVALLLALAAVAARRRRDPDGAAP